ncbi:CoA pyrophosphatase [Arsukibacterium sp.]|uniref:CoA pyrophosphatase n=1 Tax=Arsukibacterium sp. TaxID=1977258 RepID=UPI002FD9591C
MNAQSLSCRFLLHCSPIVTGNTGITQSQNPVAAAVLVPIVDYGDKLTVLFTQRALHLKHHPGQISFPGGRIESGETSQDAALREAEEEIGLVHTDVSLLGRLPEQDTSTGFVIEPWVGLIRPQHHFLLQASEVAAVFEVPLSHFLTAANRQHMTLTIQGQRRQFHAMPYQDKFIWGATAAIMHQLLLHLS